MELMHDLGRSGYDINNLLATVQLRLILKIFIAAVVVDLVEKVSPFSKSLSDCLHLDYE
jgi:hypothetical protein